MTCPACSSQQRTPTSVRGTYTCRRCGAIHGECYKGEAYGLVRFDRWDPNAATIPPEQTRYFDLMLLGSRGVERVHGWFNVATRLMVQSG